MCLTAKAVQTRKQLLLPLSSQNSESREFLTEEILMASSTAKMAELVAKEIYNIREKQECLIARTS